MKDCRISRQNINNLSNKALDSRTINFNKLMILKEVLQVGGLMFFNNFSGLFSNDITVDLPVHIMSSPLKCVVNGTGHILDNLEEFREVLIKKIEDLCLGYIVS